MRGRAVVSTQGDPIGMLAILQEHLEEEPTSASFAISQGREAPRNVGCAELHVHGGGERGAGGFELFSCSGRRAES